MKTCPYCSQEIRDKAIKCRWCKRDLSRPAQEIEAAAVPSPQSSGRADVVAAPVPVRAIARRAGFLDALASPERVFRYLGEPVFGAVLGGLGLLTLGIASAGAAYAIDPELLGGQTNRVLLVLRNGGLFAYAFLRVPFFRDSASTFGPMRTEATFVPLTGLLLAGMVLFAVGGFVARRVPGSLGTKVVAGAATALPLALASFLAPIVFPNPTGAGAGSVGAWAPFRVSAFLLPLLWAGVFGALGGMRAVFGRRWLRRPLIHARPAVRVIAGSLRGALSGVSWGIVLGVIVTAITIAVLAIEHPTERREVFADVRILLGTASGILLFLPNMAATALLASMGVPVQVQGRLEPFPLDTATYGYAHDLPAYAWAALLVPAVVVLRMGYRAARSAGGGARTAVVSGLAAAVPFTLGCWALAFLSAVYLKEDGGFLNVRLSPVGTVVLPPLWGLIGGWLGALLFIRRSRGAEGPESRSDQGNVPVDNPNAPSSGFEPESPTEQADERVGITPDAEPPTPNVRSAPPDPRVCGSCGTVNPASYQFCDRCGARLAE